MPARLRDLAGDLTESLQAVRLAEAHPDVPPEIRALLARAADGLDRAIGRLGTAAQRGDAGVPGQPALPGGPESAGPGRQPGAPAAPSLTLSPREREVLLLLAEGLSNGGIAARLGVGTATAKSHVQRLLAKLHATNRTQAVMVAARQGLLGMSG
jgi:DNA-binding CsgD family transcriptional regulator